MYNIQCRILMGFDLLGNKVYSNVSVLSDTPEQKGHFIKVRRTGQIQPVYPAEVNQSTMTLLARNIPTFEKVTSL